jgi:hypothetical protein
MKKFLGYVVPQKDRKLGFLIIGSPGRTQIPLQAGSPLRLDRFHNHLVVQETTDSSFFNRLFQLHCFTAILLVQGGKAYRKPPNRQTKEAPGPEQVSGLKHYILWVKFRSLHRMDFGGSGGINLPAFLFGHWGKAVFPDHEKIVNPGAIQIYENPYTHQGKNV